MDPDEARDEWLDLQQAIGGHLADLAAQNREHAERMLRLLENMTTEEFSRGADRPVREYLARLAGREETT